MTKLGPFLLSARGVAVFLVALMVLAACGATETTLTRVDNAAEAASTDTDDSDVAADDVAPDPAPTAPAPTAPAPTAESAAEPTAVSGPVRSGDELTPDEMACLEASGYDPVDLIEAGIAASSGTFGDDEEQIYNEVFRCAPDWALSDSFVSEFTVGLNEGVSGEISDDEGRCVVQALIDSGDGGTVLFGGDPFVVLEVFESCLTPENAAELFGEAGTGPQTYGDDAGFDLLQDRCLGNGDLNDAACDVLFFNSSADSDYEAIALTCGDRQPFSDISCVDDMFDDNDDLFIDPDSPGIPAVERACRDGAMIACDYLYSLTEFGSSTERLGGTCGDRVDFNGLDLCIVRIGEFG